MKANEKTIQQIQEDAAKSQASFVKELKALRHNQAKYGVVKRSTGGLVFRLSNSQFSGKKTVTG